MRNGFFLVRMGHIQLAHLMVSYLLRRVQIIYLNMEEMAMLLKLGVTRKMIEEFKFLGWQAADILKCRLINNYHFH